MNEQKPELRNRLFEKYFEVEDGVNIKDLMDSIIVVTDTWQDLHKILEKNLEDFDSYTELEKMKKIEYKNNNYLVIESGTWNYLIIDLETKQVLSTDEAISIFEDDFFVNELSANISYKVLLYFLKYYGNAEELIEFYNKNKRVLDAPNRIYYKLTLDDAWTYFSIDLVNARAQLGFETPNQTLYEHLFFNSDLTPSGMQDATSRIGREKMLEMFERIKEINIPESVIPKEIYQIYLESNKNLESQNNNGPKLIKKMNE